MADAISRFARQNLVRSFKAVSQDMPGGYRLFGRGLDFYLPDFLFTYYGIQPAGSLDPGVYLCQPIYGNFQTFGKESRDSFLLMLRIVAGSYRGTFVPAVLFTHDPSHRRSSEDLFSHLGLPDWLLGEKALFRGGLVKIRVQPSEGRAIWPDYANYVVTAIGLIEKPDDIPAALRNEELKVEAWVPSNTLPKLY